MFKDFSAVNKFIAVTKTYNPDTVNAIKYQQMKPIFDEAYTSLIKVYDQLARLR
jgi:hypothetical protein